MRTIHRNTLYECEVCHRQDEDMDYILRCEQQGVPKRLVNIGDTIFFKDCEETPLMFNKYTFDDWDSEVKIRCLMYTRHGVYLEVVGISRIGHYLSYTLGKNGRPLAVWGLDNNSYPIIENDLMNKVLSASYQTE